MKLKVTIATEADATALARLAISVAEDLTSRYGRGHWSSQASEKGVLRNIKTSRVLVARKGKSIIATLRLATKKPWAIDPAYFKSVGRPIYLLDMAVLPGLQGEGVGRYLVEEAKLAVRAWPGETIRLDAYDTPAGAGGFYAKCGFREVGRVTYRTVPLIYYELLLG